MSIASVHCDLIGTETRFYQTPNYRTRAIEVANGRMPLILMHGGGGHAEAYSRNLIPLSEFSQPMAIDFIWHGLSSRPKFWDGAPRSGRHWLNQFTAQVLEFLDAKGIDKAVFEGESLGGWIVADLGINHPDRVAGLVLNTAWGLTLDPAEVKELKGDYEALRLSSLEALNNPSRETIRKRMEWLMPFGDVTDEIIEIRRRIWSIPETRAALTEYYNRLFEPATDRALFNEEDLARIRAKTLVLWTSHNPILGADAAWRIGKIIEDSSVVIIDRAGHWPQWEKPGEYNQAMRQFIGSL